ncbi:MAG: hypothetical protein QOH57_3750 [Mycobacterium sp.]|nr:hypothetical protein [Mycobacterium sp.]
MRLKTKLASAGIATVIAAALFASSGLVHANAAEAPTVAAADGSVSTMAAHRWPLSKDLKEKVVKNCREWARYAWALQEDGRGYAFLAGGAVVGAAWLVSHRRGRFLTYTASAIGGAATPDNADNKIRNALRIEFAASEARMQDFISRNAHGRIGDTTAIFNNNNINGDIWFQGAEMKQRITPNCAIK